MANRYRVEAWSLPLATSTKTVEAVPFIAGSFSDPVSNVGRGSIAVRGDWDRLADVDDPDNGVSSYYRVFQDNALIGGFFGHRTSTEMADVGNKIVTIEGAAQGKVMEFARVENFDYPVRPSAEVDWNFGSGAPGGLDNGDFEEQVGSSDFEDGKLDGWKSATGGFFKSNEVGPDVDDADAQAGTFSLFWDPGPKTHSGVAKSFTVEGGGTYTFSVYLKATVTGRRFVFGTEFPKGASSGTSNGYIWNGFLFAELGNVPRNANKDGTPGGSTDGTWQQMILTITYPEFDSDPEKNTKRIEVAVQFDHHGGGTHPAARVDTFVASGPGLGLKPWHRTGNTSIVSVFEQSTEQVHGDTFSAKVTTTAADHGIAQVVDGLVAGRTYTYENWVYHEDGSNQNFTVFLKHETGGATSIATNTVSVPTATWTLMDVTGVTDDDDVTVVVRKQNASTFFVDDARLYEGQPPESWGEINQQLLDDAAVDHIAEAGNFIRDTLGFLDYTSFTPGLDSGSNSWLPAVVEYRAVRGKRYDQIQGDGLNMGFEWQVVDTGTGFSLDIYNKYDWASRTGGIGTDRRGTNVPAIKFGPGVKAGPLISAATGVNRIHAEGEDFQWDVRRDATAIGDYDTREGYEGNVNLLGDDTLGVVADQILDRTVIPTKGIKIVIDPKDDAEVPQPYVDFFPGDTYPINLIGLFQGDKRVVEITTDFTKGTAVWTVEFDQSTYTSDPLKSVVKAVQMLLDRFDELRIPKSEFLRAGGLDDHTHDKESIPSILVASSVASDEVRNMADYVCDGTDDWIEIVAAIDRLHEDDGNAGGRILLSRGIFNIDLDKIDLGEDIWLQGVSFADTILSTTDTSGDFIVTGGENKISDLLLSGPAAANPTVGISSVVGDRTIIDNVWFNTMGTAIEAGNNMQVTGCFCNFVPIFVDDQAGYQEVIISGNMRCELIRSTHGTDINGWIITDNLMYGQIELDHVNGYVISGNMFRLPNGNNDALIMLNQADNGAVTGNSSDDGTGFDAIAMTDCVGVTVGDNSFDGITHAILLTGCSRCIVNGNILGSRTAQFLGEHGVELNGSSDCIVTDNLIYEPGIDLDNTFDGILITTGSDRNDVRGNKILPQVAISPRYGINIATSDCDDNRIGDNSYGVLADYGTFPLNDAGTGTRYPTAVRAVMNVGNALVDSTTGVSRYPIHEPSIMLDAYPTVDTVPSGGAAIFDVNKNTTTMYATATNPQVASGQNVGTIAQADQTVFAAGDVIRIDVDTANSAEDAVIVVRFLVA